MPGDERNTPACDFSAMERACFGSQASSPTNSFSFLLSTPPASLASATNCSAPFCNWRPKADSLPVIGPATATVISWAKVVAESASEAKRIRPISFNDFIRAVLAEADLVPCLPLCRHCAGIVQALSDDLPSVSWTNFERRSVTATWSHRSRERFGMRAIAQRTPAHLRRGGRLRDRPRVFPGVATVPCRRRSS